MGPTLRGVFVCNEGWLLGTRLNRLLLNLIFACDQTDHNTNVYCDVVPSVTNITGHLTLNLFLKTFIFLY